MRCVAGADLQNTSHREKHDWARDEQSLRAELQGARQQLDSLKSAQQLAEVRDLHYRL